VVPDHANLEGPTDVSLRSPQFIFEKPGREFRNLQSANFVSVCQKHLAFTVENPGVRDAEQVTSGVTRYVKASVSMYNQEASPAVP
jgi:hypothetical protein